VKFSLRGAAVRGIVVGIVFAVVMYPINFGWGESVLDAVGAAICATVLLYAHGRTRHFLRRYFANPS